jgi:hypothetical protein
MTCFLLHNLSAADALRRLSDSLGEQWFPSTVGYAIARTMFELDVTAHYMSQAPAERANQYVGFSAVLRKKQMEACRRHRQSPNPEWREAMDLVWDAEWASRESEIQERYEQVVSRFTHETKKGRTREFNNWSGKSIRQMASDVDHVEAYDMIYTDLSSFAHGDVDLANRFLQRREDGWIWSQRANEGDLGTVYKHAVTFLTCFMELFAREFRAWSEAEVRSCMDMRGPTRCIQDIVAGAPNPDSRC